MKGKARVPSQGGGLSGDKLHERARGAYGGNLSTGIGNLGTAAPVDAESTSTESPVAPVAPARESPETRARGVRHTGMPGAPEPVFEEPRPGSELGKARG